MDGGWRSWEGHSRPHKYGRPPHAPGTWHSSVPQWEKKFCSTVCMVPWGKICAAKASLSAHKNVVDWDDSAALEAFQNAKARYWAEINRFPCDIPLPDPDIYIDKVDYEAVIDPKLVEDLEKRPPPPDVDTNTSVIWDSFIYANKPVPVTGWGDAEDANTAEHRSIHTTNWDAFLEKQTSSVKATGWGDADFNQPRNADTSNNHNSGWGDGAAQDYSRGGGGNYNSQNNGRDTSWGHSDNWNNEQGNYNSWNNERGTSWGHSDNWNNEQGRRNSRKRNGGNYGTRFPKSRQQMNYQANNYQTNNDNWKDCRERYMSDNHYEKTMHAGQPMAVRQWKSKHSCGPMNHKNPPESGGGWSWEKSIL
ncbi:uncharacterized protein M6B38_251065 [Iris pallida]|uniref:Uncharacterized protein n=1 Tax=Iris pallida TaxID=29817 RepID=A0AAX6IL36_IRIPA|nr:uncharacterized protein M6B38_251065 [Iris pallida]